MKIKNQLLSIVRKLVYLSLFAVGVVSCDDLTLDTQGELATEKFYSSVEDIEIGTLGVYSVLSDRLFGSNQSYCHLWAADDRTAATGSNKTYYLEYDQMIPLNTNVWQANSWNKLWQIIGAANTFLDNEEKMRSFVIENDDLETLQRSLGEVHYLRGFVYFELVRTWGTIPLLTSQKEVTGLESLASFEDIYALIIEDLIFAKNNLESTSINGIYRANKWMAQALLANVYLTTAGFPLKNNANYALAATEAKNVIDNGPFELTSSMGGVMGQELTA